MIRRMSWRFFGTRRASRERLVAYRIASLVPPRKNAPLRGRGSTLVSGAPAHEAVTKLSGPSATPRSAKATLRRDSNEIYHFDPGTDVPGYHCFALRAKLLKRNPKASFPPSPRRFEFFVRSSQSPLQARPCSAF